jgi:hypothetical protein
MGERRINDESKNGLSRKKPMKRTQIKRSGKRMRRNTKKRAKADRRASKPRKAFQNEFPWCWFCENAPSAGVHEIASGTGNRGPAVQQRFTWAAACWNCNSKRLTDKGPKGEWPIRRQLAVKWINDRDHLDLVAFNRLRGEDDNSITMAEIIPHICRLLDGKENRGRF